MLISHKIYSEPMRLLETPRSLSVYIYTCTNQCYSIKSLLHVVRNIIFPELSRHQTGTS